MVVPYTYVHVQNFCATNNVRNPFHRKFFTVGLDPQSRFLDNHYCYARMSWIHFIVGSLKLQFFIFWIIGNEIFQFFFSVYFFSLIIEIELNASLHRVFSIIKNEIKWRIFFIKVFASYTVYNRLFEIFCSLFVYLYSITFIFIHIQGAPFCFDTQIKSFWNNLKKIQILYSQCITFWTKIEKCQKILNLFVHTFIIMKGTNQYYSNSNKNAVSHYIKIYRVFHLKKLKLFVSAFIYFNKSKR